jgi:hypothetical protein
MKKNYMKPSFQVIGMMTEESYLVAASANGNSLFGASGNTSDLDDEVEADVNDNPFGESLFD